MAANNQSQTKAVRGSSDSRTPQLFFDTWKPKQPLPIKLGSGSIMLGSLLLSLFVIVAFAPGCREIPYVGSLNPFQILRWAGALVLFGLVVLICAHFVGREVPLKAEIDNDVVQALRESKVLPEKLRTGGFKRHIKTERGKGIAYVFFSIQYPGRSAMDVMPLARNIQTAFKGVTYAELIETTGRYAKKYPLTLVLHYREER